jgi:isopenicillin N synthase-like dioxygenase
MTCTITNTANLVSPQARLHSADGPTLPVVDMTSYLAARLAAGAGEVRQQREAADAQVRLAAAIAEACRTHGMFYLVGHGIDRELMKNVFVESAKFFSLSDEEKFAISARKSPQHRGYGLLKNYRDWREQIHFGVEANVPEGMELDAYWGLWGPNLWPAALGGEFKNVMLSYFERVEALSRTVLTLIAQSLEKPSDFFTGRMMDRPYLLMKTMSYLPQEMPGSTANGVTAHCDWSWLTFLLQDDVGGLEAQDIDGNWHKVEPIEDAIVVNTGELLEIETGGLLRSCPHRVINERIDRQRFSTPVFINPALDAEIVPFGCFDSDCWNAEETVPQSADSSDIRHVHRVVKPGTKLSKFVFGEAEWTRKAEGRWCYDDVCVRAL